MLLALVSVQSIFGHGVLLAAMVVKVVLVVDLVGMLMVNLR
jgi:hypothetical protein